MCGPALFLYRFLFNCVRVRPHAQPRRARWILRTLPAGDRTPLQQIFCGALHCRGTVRRHCNAAQLLLLTLREWNKKTYLP